MRAPRPKRESRLSRAITLALALLGNTARALQPPPRALPPRAQPSLTARRYGAAAANPTLSVLACGAAAGQTQTFAVDVRTRALTLADGRCLLRSGAAPGGVTAGACGLASSNWTLPPCRVPGCDSSGNESFVLSAVDGQVLGVPGAVGPSVAMWTVDSPTGACRN